MTKIYEDLIRDAEMEEFVVETGIEEPPVKRAPRKNHKSVELWGVLATVSDLFRSKHNQEEQVGKNEQVVAGKANG